MKTHPSDQQLEALSLNQLIMAWTNMMWWVGMRPLLDQMNRSKLSFPETIVLRNLQRGPLNVADVAQCISIDQSSASRAADRLVRDGYVDRHENPEDRRQKLLTLTASGEHLLEDLEQVMASAMEPMLRALSDREREQFRTLVTKMLVEQSNNGMVPPDAVHMETLSSLVDAAQNVTALS